MDGRKDGWTDGWVDGLIDGWTDGWMDGWITPDNLMLCGRPLITCIIYSAEDRY